jgi:ribonuclease BN (tRNA processing enzyme)
MNSAARRKAVPSESIRFLCLGSGAAMSDGRPYSSILVDDRILLDLPPTAVVQLHRFGVAPAKIDTIFISHVHADHVFGLPFLLLEYCICYERSEPLNIVGPPGLEKTVDLLCELAWPDMKRAGFVPHVPIVYTEVEAGRTYRVSDLEFVPFAMKHFGLAAFGYRIDYRGRTIAFSGDAGESPEIERLMERADAAILELTCPRVCETGGHLGPDAFVRYVEPLVKAGALVLATHMGKVPEDPIDGVTLCEEGHVYRI